MATWVAVIAETKERADFWQPSTSNFIRLCETFGSDGTPDAEWKPVRKGLLARLFG